MVRAYEQRQEAVQAWLNETYPGIKSRAVKEKAEIYWCDETALVNTDVQGRVYQPKGKTLLAYAVGGAREKLSMISAVTNQGKASWMIVEENFNADKFILRGFKSEVQHVGYRIPVLLTRQLKVEFKLHTWCIYLGSMI